MIDKKRFIQRMKKRWEFDFGNTVTTELVKAWEIILSSFNAQLDGKKGLLTCDAVCGTGKTTSVMEACGILAREQPRMGALVVVRLISQADEVAEGINNAAGREVAIPLHSGKGGKHTPVEIEEAQVVVITHARYLASVSPSGGKQSFRNWKHGERKLRICDESLDLVERHTLTKNEIIGIFNRLTSHRDYFGVMREVYQKEYRFLEQVATRISTGDMVMGFNKGVFDDILLEQKEPIYLSSFLDTLKSGTKDDWVGCKPTRGVSAEANFEEWREETIAYVQTFDRIVRYRNCFIDKDRQDTRVSTGTFLLPESFDSLVVLDATSNVDKIYEYFETKSVTKYSVDRTVRNFKNARLHFRPDNSGLGKNETKKTMTKRIPQILKWANEKFKKGDRVLFAGHKDLMDNMRAVLLKKEYDFVDKKQKSDGSWNIKNVDFAHYGVIDGKNTWKDYENVVILSIPYLPSYYSPTAMMALASQDRDDFEDKDDIASSNVAVKLIQLICRIAIRKVKDDNGNCPESDIYLLLDGDEPFPGDVNYRPLLKRTSPYLLSQIEESLHNITVMNWIDFNGFQTRTSNSIPKGGVSDSFITWLRQIPVGETKTKKEFETSCQISEGQRKSLTVLLCKKTSPVRRSIDSMNVVMNTRRGLGTTFTRLPTQ